MIEQILQHEDSLAIVMVFSMAITAILVFGSGWIVVSVAQIISHHRLKHMMIERGMTPEEIDKILKSTAQLPGWPPGKPSKAGHEKPQPIYRS